MIVLASASPRRSELLKQVGCDFIVRPSQAEEIVEHVEPRETARHNALVKAQDIARGFRQDIVIGADTIVVHRGVIYGKPKSEEDAEAMLTALSGDTHQVMTGIAVIQGETVLSEVVVTDVKMRAFSTEEIRRYIATGEPMDKAGAYGIQGIGALLVEKIDGCYNNVVGLPIARLANMLKEVGTDLLG